MKTHTSTTLIDNTHGLKFTEFKAKYHEGKLGFASAHANVPIAAGSDPEEVVGAVHRALDRAGAH